MIPFKFIGPIHQLAFMTNAEGVREYFYIEQREDRFIAMFPPDYSQWNEQYYSARQAMRHIKSRIKCIDQWSSFSQAKKSSCLIRERWYVFSRGTSISAVRKWFESEYDVSVNEDLNHKYAGNGIYKLYMPDNQPPALEYDLLLAGSYVDLYSVIGSDGHKEFFRVQFDGLNYHAAFPFDFSIWENGFPDQESAVSLIHLMVDALNKWNSLSKVKVDDGTIAEDWLCFEKGESLQAIWYWFETNYQCSIDRELKGIFTDSMEIVRLN